MIKKVWIWAFFLFFANDCAAAVTTQNFNVHIGIFDAAKVSLYYNNDKERYVIRADVQTTNLFNKLYPLQAMYESRGKILNSIIKPEIYDTSSTTRNHVRTKKVFYDSKGVAYKKISSKDEKVSEAKIANVSKNADTSDMQTVFAMLIQKFSKEDNCSLVQEVDDGKKHYKVHVTDKGYQKKYFDILSRDENAHLCSIFIENLAENNDNILWEVSADRPIQLWVQKDDKTKLPKILEIYINSTPLGELKVIPIINEESKE